MAYITQANLTGELSEVELMQLTDDERIGAINVSRVAEEIDNACTEIDTFLGARYTVPLALPLPGSVKGWAVKIAVYLLYLRRHRVPPDVRIAYEDVIARLKDVRDGKMSLGIEPPPPTSTVAHQGAVYLTDRLFTRATLEGF